MYTILNKTFTSFDELIQWVWNTYKIDFDDDPQQLTELQKLDAIKELELLVKDD